MDDIVDSVARHLLEMSRQGNTGVSRDWSQLSAEQRQAARQMAQQLLVGVIDQLIHLAEREVILLEDVAESAEYWLIEIQERLRLRQEAGRANLVDSFEHAATPPAHDHTDGHRPDHLGRSNDRD